MYESVVFMIGGGTGDEGRSLYVWGRGERMFCGFCNGHDQMQVFWKEKKVH